MQYLCEKRCVFLFWRLKTDIVSGDRGQCVDKKRKRGLKERPTEKRVKEKMEWKKRREIQTQEELFCHDFGL